MTCNTLKNEKKCLVRRGETLLFIGLTLFIGLSVTRCSKDNSQSKQAQTTAKKDKAVAKSLKKFILTTCANHNPSAMFIKYQHLAQYLQKSTGFHIELFQPEDFKEFKSKIQNQEVDFLFVDPVVYLEIKDSINTNHLYGRLSGLGGELKDKPYETGCLIARADSMINSLEDLKGKGVLFGSQRSAIK